MLLQTSVPSLPSSTFVLIVGALIIYLIILSYRKEEYHSHWSQLLANFKFSTKEFYDLVKEEMISHQIEGLAFDEVSIKIGNAFSSKRIYLRVAWKHFYYDMCFAPFGDGCFVSWWLFDTTTATKTLLSRIPIVNQFFDNNTYYNTDTASAFMSYTHNSVLAVIDRITEGTGVRVSQEDRKPILKELHKR